MAKQKPVYILDLETDPFAKGSLPLPFAAGLYANGEFFYEWGPDCIAKIRKRIEALPPGIIYAHNGGRFDMFYCMDWLTGNMLMINSRIVKAEMKLPKGKHEIRDSYSILPMPLRDYKKDEIDYNKMHRSVREQHKEEIVSYLKGDCIYLFELVSNFLDRFGDQITIGSTALKELKKIHTFSVLSEAQDCLFRGVEKKTRDEQGYIVKSKVKPIKQPIGFYYGGRVQCFRDGVIKTPVKVYDVNSMYPHVMESFLHPVGFPSSISQKVQKTTCFVLVEGRNYGAFPVREKNGIRFDVEYGTFGVSIHEWKAAVSLGLFEPTKMHACHNFNDRRNFAEFVSTFYNARNLAKDSGDIVSNLFYKLILNSAYGKFAQNPENYFEFKITDSQTILPNKFSDPPGPWVRDWIVDGEYTIWKKPCMRFVRHNVAAAASITGAARAVLMRGLAAATNPLYCDTDSIICEDLPGVEVSGKKLGAWKLEAEGTRIAIAGKKLYAVFDDDQQRVSAALEKAIADRIKEKTGRGESINEKEVRAEVRKKLILNGPDGNQPDEICIKLASKGCRIGPYDIQDVANGGEFIYDKESPSFKWDGSHLFLSRTIRNTARRRA